MSDETNTANTEANTTQEEKFVPKRQVFQPGDEKLADYLGKLAEFADPKTWLTNLKVIDTEDGPDMQFADDKATMIYPLKERVEGQKSKVSKIVVVQVPTVQEVISSPKGDEFVAEAIFAQIAGKVGNAARAVVKGDATRMPVTLHDFMERQTRGEPGSATFTELAPAMLQYLASQSPAFKQVTVSIFRKMLSNAEYAKAGAFHPLEEKGQFVKIIQAMEIQAKNKGLDPQIFAAWLETRDQQTFEVNPDIDLGSYLAAEPTTEADDDDDDGQDDETDD